ncbi:MAG: hypothetical protein ABS35_18335 [Kaistia sp. SCN 65-12]|nr:MAG: hypothetical protein ABS35_18335 [Kaistia sp. SCN 65-12]
MIKIVRNNKRPDQAAITTLGDLHRFIETCDLPAGRKAQIRSAIKKTDELVGHGALDLAANPAKLLAALDQYSPAMAGLSDGGFANLKSRLRKAFKLAKPHLISTRHVRLEGEWLQLHDQLVTREQRELSRFLRFACAAEWKLAEVGDNHVERFVAHLRDEAMVASWEPVVRNTIRAWNRAASDAQHPGLQPLTPPVPKRTSYWIDPASLPASMRADMEAFLAHLSAPAIFASQSRIRLKPGTVKQYRHGIVMLISALAEAGEDLASMTRLGDVVTASKVEKALLFLHERFGQRITSGMVLMAARSRKIAVWAKLPDEAIVELDNLIERLEEAAPSEKGLTAKNKALLDRLDDARFRDLVYLLPHTLMTRAMRQRQPVWGASVARAAVAIELLLTCSMRRENLISLELERNIRRIGSGRDARWIIEFEQQDVKNEEPLRYTLPKESADLLEEYLHHWRPVLCDGATSWLFPAADGRRMVAPHLAEDIKRKSERELGVPVTPHQFRHISAELYLRDNPDKLAVVSNHLGHRDLNTTRTYYARRKQREASRMYQERLGLDRSQAAERVGRRSRRKTALDGLRQEDLL